MVPAQPRSTGFSMRVFKRFPEVIPLVGIIGAAVVGLTVWSGYALITKTDVKLKRSDLNRWDTIDLNKPQKLVTFNQQYGGEDPAITALKREIADAYKGM